MMLMMFGTAPLSIVSTVAVLLFLEKTVTSGNSQDLNLPTRIDDEVNGRQIVHYA